MYERAGGAEAGGWGGGQEIQPETVFPHRFIYNPIPCHPTHFVSPFSCFYFSRKPLSRSVTMCCRDVFSCVTPTRV